MDDIVDGYLSGIPVSALSLQLERSTIKMRHGAAWRVDKSNAVHDLIVCLDGAAEYRLDDEPVRLAAGDAMLIPAGSRFVGRIGDASRYIGIAQHFTINLFGNVDLITQMRLKNVVRLKDWDVLKTIVKHYHDTAPLAHTTLAQNHLFMVILLAFLEDAFISWRKSAVGGIDGQDALSLSIILSASRLAADPMADGILETVMREAPYNADYFRRAFRDKIGHTPQKFLEFKKMEQAMHLLSTGHSVKETAAQVGYNDPYFFSRMFKRYMGTSPSSYRLRLRTEQVSVHTET